MPITERGRWTSAKLDERGRFINNGIIETGQRVFSITGVPTTPTDVPKVTIISVDHNKISDELGINSATVKFTFDTDVTSWSVNVMGASSDTGTIADSGGAVTANTEITAIIDYTELYQEGYNKVNIYGQNSLGWTPYEEDPNAPKVPVSNVISSDSFDKANSVESTNGWGTADTGENWVPQTSGYNSNNTTLSINNNQGYLYGDDRGVVLDCGQTDYIVSVKMYSVTTNPQIIVRADTTSKTYYYIEYNNSSDIAVFFMSGGAGEVARKQGVAFANGDKMSVKVEGSTIYVYVNDILQLTVPNSINNQTSTMVGVGSGNGTSVFDDFIVEQL